MRRWKEEGGSKETIEEFSLEMGGLSKAGQWGGENYQEVNCAGLSDWMGRQGEPGMMRGRIFGLGDRVLLLHQGMQEDEQQIDDEVEELEELRFGIVER